MTFAFLLTPEGSKVAMLVLWWIGLFVISLYSFFAPDVTFADVFYWCIELSITLMLSWIFLQLVIHGLNWGF